MSLGDEKYISFTIFKRDGTAVASPVWIVPLDDGTFGFWTSSKAGKAKRLRNSSKVIVQPSDARGRVKAGTDPMPGTAVLATGAPLEAIRPKVKAKYGVMVPISRLGNTLGHLFKEKQPYGDVGVVITLD